MGKKRKITIVFIFLKLPPPGLPALLVYPEHLREQVLDYENWKEVSQEELQMAGVWISDYDL